MFVSNPSTLAHICQSIRYKLVSVLLLSRFVKVRCLSHGVKATLCPKSNPIHTIFTNCAPFPLHFHSISISIWISTPLKGSRGGLKIAPPSGARYKNTPVGRGLNTDQICSTRSEPRSVRELLMTSVQNCICDPRKGHLRLNNDVMRSMYVFDYNF